MNERSIYAISELYVEIPLFCIQLRLLLVGYFEGIESERGIAWRAADSLGLRRFLGIGIDVETHHKVFMWILEVLRDRGLVKGKTVGIDATALEANAATRSIVRRDAGRVTKNS